jgi:hypothetical protein
MTQQQCADDNDPNTEWTPSADCTI